MNTVWKEIDIHGCYSLGNTVFEPICAGRNSRQIWRHSGNTPWWRGATVWAEVTSQCHIKKDRPRWKWRNWQSMIVLVGLCARPSISKYSLYLPTLTLSQWSSSGNPVAIQCAWNSDPSVHRNATGEMPVCFQWCSSGLPVAFQWSSSVFQLCKLTLDRHWDTTGCQHQPVWFQWHPSVLVAPVVFQCVSIMQINTGSPLEHHWALASASVVPVAFQCTCGSSGLPVWSVQWHPSVPTESGLEVIRSDHFPACDP